MQGHNNPPAETAFSIAIDDLYAEAANFLDGEPIANQGQADAVGQITAQLRDVRNAADAARKEEKRPHDEAAKAVQDRFNPVLVKADRAIAAGKKAVSEWLIAEDNRMRAEAEEQARLADEKARAAQQAIQSAASLEDHEKAEAAIAEAKAANVAAKRADKATANVAGSGRAMGLRTYYTASVTDYSAFLAWLKQHRPDDLKAALDELAAAQCRAGNRVMAGVLVEEERKAA